MRRRDFITFISRTAVAWPLAARAQQPDRMRLIGVLHGFAATDLEWQRRIAAFRQSLKELGWIEGQNIAIDIRSAFGKLDTLPALAAELVAMNANVIVTQGTEPAVAASRATRSIPIVMASIGDAVGTGIIPSLARPGGNITGLTLVATEQAPKRLQLLTQILPRLSQVAALWNTHNFSHRLAVESMKAGAQSLNVRFQSVGVQSISDIEKGLSLVARAGSGAVISFEDLLIVSHRARIIDLAMSQRIPVVGEFRPFAETGALMTYGPSLIGMWRRAADYVDKIFRGANPSDLPVEQPATFELLINLKTAKALELTIPQSLLVAADEVIE